MSDPLIPPPQASSAGTAPLFSVTRQSEATRVTPSHRHTRGQLLGATRGLLSIEAGEAQQRVRWVVPATHAVWIPPDCPHALHSHGPFAGWSAYVRADACAALPERPCMLAMSGLLREALARAASWRDAPLDRSQLRLADVILDEIGGLPRADLGLPLPHDTRLLGIARALSQQPGDTRKLETWAKQAGLAPRTLTRRFSVETGFSFTAWRQRVRLLRALELLAAGRPVKAIARELGYDNVSAFIALFRRTFGVTPGRYGGRAA